MSFYDFFHTISARFLGVNNVITFSTFVKSLDIKKPHVNEAISRRCFCYISSTYDANV